MLTHINRLAIFLCFLLSLSVPTGAQSVEWELLPGPEGAAVRSLSMNADGEGVLLTGKLRIYVTRDVGETWQPVTPLPSSGHFLRMLNSGTLIVLTAKGIARSTDLGASWEMVEQLNGSADYLSEDRRGRIFASVRVATETHVIASSDDGLTWSRFHQGLHEQSAALRVQSAPDGTVYALDANQRLFRLNETTSTWERSDSLPLFNQSLLFRADGRIIIAFEGATALYDPLSKVITPFEDDEAPQGVKVFKQNPDGDILAIRDHDPALPDSGAWKGIYVFRLPAKSDRWIAEPEFYSRDVRLTSMVFNSHNEILLIGNQGVYAFDTERKRYELRINGLVELRFDDFAITPKGVILMVTGQRFFRSEDGGSTWQYVALPEEYKLAHSVICVGPGSTVYLASPLNTGLLVQSQDAGLTWRSIATPEEAYHQLFCASSGNLFGISHSGNLSAMDAATEQWTIVDDNKIQSIAELPDGELIGLGWATVHSSTDGGISWRQISVTKNILTALRYNPYAESLIAYTGPTGLVVSRDAGVSWQPSGAGSLGADSQNLIFTSEGRWIAATRNDIVESIDFGVSWRPHTDELPDRPIKLALANDRLYFSGGNFGLYRSAARVTSLPQLKQKTSDVNNLRITPMPAEENTILQFTLARAEAVRVSLIDIRGGIITVGNYGLLAAGAHKLPLALGGLARGRYNLVLHHGQQISSRTIIVNP